LNNGRDSLGKPDQGALHPGFEAGVVNDFLRQFPQVHEFPTVPVHPGVKAGQGQDFVNETVQTLHFMLHAHKARFELSRVLPNNAQGHLQADQGGAEFVGYVMQQPLLGQNQVLQVPGHAIELQAQIVKFISASSQVSDPGIQPSRAHGCEGFTQSLHGPGQIPGQ
jgi:hypothetical protein